MKSRVSQSCLVTLLVVATVPAAYAQIHFTQVDTTPLARFGPVDPTNGYPIWAEDANGLILEMCLDTTQIEDPFDPLVPCPVCIDPALDLPDPTLPVSFPDNYPEEAFYMQATALMDTSNGGRALLVIALEAAFDGLGTVQDGEQIVFSRVRVRIDNAMGMEPYKIIHPYGEVIVDSEGTGPRGINISNDIFLWKQALGGNLSGLVGNFGTFLQSDNVTIGPEFVGDPCVEGTVNGSPFGTNVFRIEGPNIADPSSPWLCKDAAGNPDPTQGPDPASTTDCIETDLFTLVAKGASKFGAEITRATYRRDATATHIDVWAKSSSASMLEVSGDNFGATPMLSDGAGNFYAHVVHSSGMPIPGTVTVTNLADMPPTTATAPVVDAVAVPVAIYDLDAVDAAGNPSPTLTITASSSKADGGAQATLTVGAGSASPPGGLATGANGSVSTSIGGVSVPPTKVTVNSSFGGFDEVPVVVISTVAAPLANAGAIQVAPFGATVTLDGGGSTGVIDTYTWTQVANGAPTVALTPDALDPAKASFTMPAGPASVLLEFELRVESTSGFSVDTTAVTNPIIANAGVDQNVLAEAIVTLDGCASSGFGLDFGWKQIAGPPAALSDPNVCNPTFTLPLIGGTLTWELTVSGPGGSAIDTVDVNGPAGRPVAHAGGNQTVLVGEVVQLDGGLSLGVIDTWTWTQLIGDPVQLGILQPFGAIDFTSGSNVPDPVFIFPSLAQTLRFQLVVSGPGGTSDPVTVDITAADPFVPDDITIEKAQYDSGKNEWRVEGITTGLGPNNVVTLWLAPPFNAANAIGSGIVDAAGKWKIQGVTPTGGAQDPTVAGAPNVLTAASTNGGSGTGGFTIK